LSGEPIENTPAGTPTARAAALDLFVGVSVAVVVATVTDLGPGIACERGVVEARAVAGGERVRRASGVGRRSGVGWCSDVGWRFGVGRPAGGIPRPAVRAATARDIRSATRGIR
jgi:hypothetical protein